MSKRLVRWDHRAQRQNIFMTFKRVPDDGSNIADQWTTTAAQDEGEWRRTAEQGAEHFMAKWIAAEKDEAGLRHAVVCPNVTGRT